jgi:hypothetical protein
MFVCFTFRSSVINLIDLKLYYIPFMIQIYYSIHKIRHVNEPFNKPASVYLNMDRLKLTGKNLGPYSQHFIISVTYKWGK